MRKDILVHNQITMIIIIIICVFGALSQALKEEGGVTYYYTATPNDEVNFSIAEFSIWCPKNVEKYRGILYLAPGYGDNSLSLIDQERWQDIAREHNFVLLTSFMLNNDKKSYSEAEKGSGQELLNALKYFADKMQHPEIAHAPLAMWGYSAGGQFNYHFACWKPERVITFISVKGGYYLSTPKSKTIEVPALFFTGEDDLKRRKDAANNLFNQYIKYQPLWCLANEPNAAHEVGRTYELAIPWLNEMIEQRLPKNQDPTKNYTILVDIDRSKGWLGDRANNYVAPINEYKGKNYTSSWLPNEKLARKWGQFHSPIK